MKVLTIGASVWAHMALVLSMWLLPMVAAQAQNGWVDGKTIGIRMDSPAPYRVYFLNAPMRMVVDLENHDWADATPDAFVQNSWVSGARLGAFRPGLSRLVLDLAKPLELAATNLRPDGDTIALHLTLKRVDADAFAKNAVLATPREQTKQAPLPSKDPNRLLIAIDPGHGGIDPGAIRDGVMEKSIALETALQLRALIAADPTVDAFLTRTTDHFVSLDDRVGLARATDADVFVSIHANTVEWGNAEGASIFTLSDEASDTAAAELADYENRADLAAGLHITTTQNDVAQLLADMARHETDARSRTLGDVLVTSLTGQIPIIRSKPHRSAGFRVLRAPDMPSVLLELGFMSNAKDRARMTSRDWQRKAAAAVLEAVKTWAKQDDSLSDWAARR